MKNSHILEVQKKKGRKKRKENVAYGIVSQTPFLNSVFPKANSDELLALLQ